MTELPMEQPVIIEGDDSDEIAEQLPGWNLEVIRLGRGILRGSGVLVPMGQLRIASVHFGVAAVLRGTSPKGYSSLVSTSPTAAPVRIGSRQIGGGTCLMLGSHAPVEIYLPENGSAFIVSLFAATHAERTKSQATGKLPARGRAELRSLTTDQSALLSRCMELIEQLRRAGAPQDAAQIQHQIYKLLTPSIASLFAQSAPLPRDSGDKATRRLAVSRACAYIDLHLRQPITLKDLCDIAGVRARTLEYGFREFYDVGPMAYFRRVRLSRVRRDLLKLKAASGSVAKTARRWRFTHMGQFSRDYRILFGESPSQTLARNEGRVGKTLAGKALG